MEENVVTLTDSFSGVTVKVAEWDFRSMTAETFKQRFEVSIQKPLQDLLNNFKRNPIVEMPRSLQMSLLGLIRGIAQFYKYILSRSDTQVNLNLRQMFGPQTSRQVCFLYFQSMNRIRKVCLSIIDTNRSREPFTVRPRSLEDMEETFFGPAFACQRSTMRRGAMPGVSFPVLVCWKIMELVPTNCPDTFLEPKIVRLQTEEELRMCPTSAGMNTNRKTRFYAALAKDPDLAPYKAETCALCEGSGVEEKPRPCSRCRVARYCCKEHQVEHWPLHKKHCKRLLVLKQEQGYRPESIV
ncbi:expressed unknown protein [Seminavis robusta]|uniref:MYND-type domain-containing protein n=1 Tax=Seminavis robusta TaxID=568900 RepID=A0A9N8EKS6_9STRA|nr:expressed unknown protein [Seminavis robusta]|eukprot:Sro1126_g244111.1  (297) ;mRNA; r:29043-29933